MKKRIRNVLKNQEFIFSGLVYILLFLFLLHPYRDYDWGWHYKMGEYFWKTGRILFDDRYSWTMPGYQWVNHEWLYDPLMYVLFKNFSFLGMSVAGAAVSIVWFILGIKRVSLSYWKKAILALFFANTISGVIWQGLRSQMIGVLLLSILVYFIPDILNGRKKILIGLPFFFLLFANLHGYFTIGFAVLGLAIFGTLLIEFREIKNSKKGFYIPKNLLFASLSLFAAFIATLCNPYTYYVYIEALKHIQSPLLKYIGEWDPVDFYSSFFVIFAVYVLFLVYGFARRRKKEDIPYILISIFILYFAITARRYLAPFVAITIPFAALFLSDIHIHLEKFKTTAFIFVVGVLIGFEIAFFRRIPFYNLLNYTFRDYCNFGSHCSEDLTTYLKNHPPKGHGFNFYDWGGYLIGRDVPVKLFIDGRMHLWEGRNGFQPFLSYEKMYYEKDFDRFTTDNFDFVIIPRDSAIAQKILQGTDLGRWRIAFLDDLALYAIKIRP